MRHENEGNQKCVTTWATGTQPCWGALGEDREQNSEFLSGRGEAGGKKLGIYLLDPICYY